MIVANIHNAKTNLSKLIEQAEAGEDVVIARNGKPAVRLTPIAPAALAARRPDGLPAWMGVLEGKITIAPDFDAVDAQISEAFEKSEIFPKDDGHELGCCLTPMCCSGASRPRNGSRDRRRRHFASG